MFDDDLEFILSWLVFEDGVEWMIIVLLWIDISVRNWVLKLLRKCCRRVNIYKDRSFKN